MKDNQPILEVDRIIHEPARLLIVTILSMAEKADFLFLLNETGLTRGNLSTHLSKLEAAGYVNIEKSFRGKIPQTLCSLTPAGQEAFEKYRKQINQFLKRT
ncbi:MAG: ArsR family transcriptional regulator [Chloroflexi bacterium HGW-Chloroflexi-3]|nr:MAG: ArsR family transcriptional regulator [Chloroflexi bacterium HGW-Chloroflexi-3]